jgi:hypothetical protein
VACFDWFLSLLLYKENEIKAICMLSRPSDDYRVTEHYLAPFPSEIPNPNKLVVFFLQAAHKVFANRSFHEMDRII